MGVELKSKIIVGGERMSVKMWKAFRNVGWRQSKAQILDRAVERSCFGVELLNIGELFGSEDERYGIGISIFVGPPTAATSDDVSRPR